MRIHTNYVCGKTSRNTVTAFEVRRETLGLHIVMKTTGHGARAGGGQMIERW